MDDKKIGMFIASLRNEYNMTQQDLSDKLIMSRENVSKMERGVNKVTTENLVKLSNIFDISVNELLSGKRKTNNNEKEIDNIILKFKYKNELKYSFIVFILICTITIFLCSLLFTSVSKNTYIYEISIDNDLNGIIIFNNGKGYIKLFNKIDLNKRYILYYIDNNQYKNYSFISFNHSKNINIKEKNKEIILVDINDISYLLSFNYNNYKINSIIKNTYLRIIDEEEEKVFKVNYINRTY